MGHRAAAAWLDRQTWLGAVERLDLTLFVRRQHDGMFRRIDVKAQDIANLDGELRIVGQLESLYRVRSQAVAAPDAMH